MSIVVAATKRAKGRLFARVQLGDEARDCRLVAQAQGPDGGSVPLVCRSEGDEGFWMVILPSLSVTQSVTLRAVAEAGDVVEEQVAKFGPLSARVSNPLQAMRSRARSAWQQPDERAALGEWDVWVERLVATRSGQEICQGHARLLVEERGSAEGSVRVRALDAHGHDIAPDGWTSLCDEIRPAQAHPGYWERYVEFSLRVPSSASALVIWVTPEADAQLPDGFAALTPRVAASLREAWRSLTVSAYDDDAYDAWFAGTHAASGSELAMQRAATPGAPASFSVVCVAREAEPDALRASVDSVLAQTYDAFELVLVNAAPNNHRLETSVRGMELADARIHFVPLAADFGSAAALSEGIDAATGAFVCLLREGDLLAPDALWRLAATLADEPDADLLYTDEDEVVRGHHVHPLFKPDWDPDLLLGYPYLGGLLCLRKELLHDMETMDSLLDGAETYRLALYASARARSVVHVPRVLYHARSASDDKPRGAAGQASSLLALRQHLADTPVVPRASARVPGGFDLTYELPDEPPLVSVIVLNRDRVASLDRCLTSLATYAAYPRYEVIVVENGSTESETFAYYRQAEEADERVRTIYYQVDDVFDEASLINFGVSRAQGELLLLLHNDVELTDQTTVPRLAALCLRPGTAAASARMLRTDGTIECCGAALSAEGPLTLRRYQLAADESDVALSLLHATTVVPGSCLMVRRDVFDAVGGMHLECGSRLGVEELCLRLWGQGYRVVLDPQASVVHHRPLASDVPPVDETAHRYQAVGRLWDVWPFSRRATDPMLGALADPASAYRSLPA